MAKVKVGDKVRVHYRGFLKDGTMFDSSLEREPLEFTLGKGAVIPAFENAVIGMNEGDTKTVSISPEDAFGHYDKDLVDEVERSKLPSHIKPEVGMRLDIRSPDGGVTKATITAITEDTVTLDGNHPLAGKDLDFEIKLLEIISKKGSF